MKVHSRPVTSLQAWRAGEGELPFLGRPLGSASLSRDKTGGARLEGKFLAWGAPCWLLSFKAPLKCHLLLEAFSDSPLAPGPRGALGEPGFLLVRVQVGYLVLTRGGADTEAGPRGLSTLAGWPLEALGRPGSTGSGGAFPAPMLGCLTSEWGWPGLAVWDRQPWASQGPCTGAVPSAALGTPGSCSSLGPSPRFLLGAGRVRPGPGSGAGCLRQVSLGPPWAGGRPGVWGAPFSAQSW